MENKFEILEIIDKYIDLDTYKHQPINRHGITTVPKPGEDFWYDTHNKINDELKKKGLIGEHQNLYFSWAMDGSIDNIHLQLETRCLPDKIPMESFEIDGASVTVRRRDLEDIEAAAEAERKARFDFRSDEWKNYKRTKMMDRMLNGI